MTVSSYAKRFTGYGTGPRLTSPGVWRRVRHGTAPAPGVSPPHPPHDTRPRDRGGVRARVVASRPRDVAPVSSVMRTSPLTGETAPGVELCGLTVPFIAS